MQSAEAKYADREYQFDMTAVLDAPADKVQHVLRDYDHYETLDSRIIEARVIERPEANVAILATTLRACFGPVCRNVKRTERVEEAPLELTAITDPARSDMTFGETRTQLSELDSDRTLVTYRTRLKPGFWVPALVARGMMLRTLEDATVELFKNVEKKAREQ